MWKVRYPATTGASSPAPHADVTSVRTAATTLGAQRLADALPKEVEHWSLTSLREKLVKIGAKVVSHGRYVTFQLAEVAVPRMLFAEILRLIALLRPPPDPAPA